MFYHVVRRPLHSNASDSSTQPRTNQRSGSVSPAQLMPRYHYSRTPPNASEVSLTDTHSKGHSIKPPMATAAMPTSNNSNNAYSSFTSTFIPFVTNNRTITPTLREFIQIPVNREDGAPVESANLSRSVPITYIAESSASPSLENNNSTKSTFTNLLRPSSRYFQHHFINSHAEEPIGSTSTAIHVPSATRRLSLSVPVVTSTAGTDNDTAHSRILVSPIRQIPVRFPHTTTTNASTPTSNSRISSAILRSSPLSHSLQRRRTDLGDVSSVPINNPPPSPSPSSDFNVTSASTLPVRRAEAMARQAILNLTQQQQQRNSALAEGSNRSSPPPPSRRLIINLKNNQCVSLDSHLSAATKLPPLPFSPRSNQRNNIYHIPVLHELQMPPHPSAVISEPAFQSTSTNNGNYKNELRMEIPVTFTTSNDQENEIQPSYVREDGFTNGERLRPPHPRQTLKSILKRSSSRETVSRKNVSFMNA